VLLNYAHTNDRADVCRICKVRTPTFREDTKSVGTKVQLGGFFLNIEDEPSNGKVAEKGWIYLEITIGYSNLRSEDIAQIREFIQLIKSTPSVSIMDLIPQNLPPNKSLDLEAAGVIPEPQSTSGGDPYCFIVGGILNNGPGVVILKPGDVLVRDKDGKAVEIINDNLELDGGFVLPTGFRTKYPLIILPQRAITLPAEANDVAINTDNKIYETNTKNNHLNYLHPECQLIPVR
jgi:hypothetical protein